MLPVLLGVPGKLATLLDRLTAARAAYLDAAITSRAEGGTVYSSARAAKLDYLDAAISSLAAAPTIQTGWNRVTSFSTGTIETETYKYTDITITAVSAVANCVVLLQGAATISSAPWPITGYLVNTTTLRISSGYSTAPAEIRARWTVIDYGA